MKQFTRACILLFVLLCACRTLRAQTSPYCTNNNRFTQNVIYTEAQIRNDTGIVYGQDTTWLGAPITLKMNIHQPKPTLDTNTKHPFIMMLYGGSFTTGTRWIVDTLCIELARRGYVTANIDYRLGWTCSDSLSYLRAAYRAMQDLHAALRFVSANAATMRVDTAWMFAGGQSAGSGTVLGLVYTQQSEINAVYPQLSTLLGNINKADNSLTNKFTLKGIFNNWGSVEAPFFDIADALPMVSFHGDQDGVVNIDSAQELNCFTAPPWAYGSRAIHQKIVAAGICSDLTVKLGGHHGVFTDDSTDISFRAGRAACFFKMLFCNSCISAYREVTQRDPEDTNCPQTGSRSSAGEMHGPGDNWYVYPNPANNTVTVSGVDRSKDFILTVLDATGRKILTARNSTTIDISPLSRGLYIIRMEQDGHMGIRKLVKE